MKLLQKKRVFALLLLSFLLILFFNSALWGKLLYPVHYRGEIVAHAQKYGVDPLLLASIIRVESNYKADRVSKKGAMGLMQIMPDTAEWILLRKEFAQMSTQRLENPTDNINMGAWYVNWLLEQFHGNVTAALAGYNAGPGNAEKWLSSGVWDGTLKNVENIPFGETRHFVVRVSYYYDKYTEVYKNGL